MAKETTEQGSNMKLTGLNAETHRHLKLHRHSSFAHTAGYHSATLAANEIPKAALSYPVLFAKDERGLRPVALLSLVQNENQYLDGDTWRANYIPAAVRVYPFRLSGEQVLIDEAAPHFQTDERGDTGEALFDDEGKPTPVLGEAIEFLRACHASEAETQPWCQRLADMGLLIERHADVVSPQGTRYRVEGFYAVDPAKIGQLPDAELTKLVRDGSLALIHAHLLSLEHLVSLAKQRDAVDSGSATGQGDGKKGKPARKKH